jgi:predicted SnoaL-like aldol condensation-catalyzing enzyme
MNHAQAKNFIENLFNDVWTKLDASELPHYYHQDVALQMGKQIAHYQDIEHRLSYVKKHYTSITNILNDILVDGNKITVRLKQTYHTKDDIEYEYAMICIYQLEKNKIKHAWACIDPNVNYFE